MFRFYGLLKVKLKLLIFRLAVLYNMMVKVAIVSVCNCTKSYFMIMHCDIMSFVNVDKNNTSMSNSLITNLNLCS